jgi:hypothetical protein
MIVLAKNVTDVVFERRFLPIKARYLLDENQDLYIRKAPGKCHAFVQSQVICDCGNWVDGHDLLDSDAVGNAVINDYDRKKLEPDVAIFARSDGANRTPRCVIEIEVSNRSPREMKGAGGSILSRSQCSLNRMFERMTTDPAFQQ